MERFLRQTVKDAHLKKAGLAVITLGIILLVLSLFVAIAALKTLGIILIVVGLVLALMGGMGRSVGGRRHYW